jgi:hypothetical protein
MNELDEIKEMFLVADNHYFGAINSYNANKNGLYYKYDPTSVLPNKYDDNNYRFIGKKQTAFTNGKSYRLISVFTQKLLSQKLK